MSLLSIANPGPLELQRVAVVVGNNQGMSNEVELRYAESDAKRIARVLTDMGSFSPRNVHLLLGKKPAALKEKLKALPGKRDERMVFVYYSGHGDGRHFHMGGAKLSFEALQAQLGSIGARVSIVVVDACRSGAMIRTKGARLGPAYDIRLLDNPEVRGQIIITSSSEHEVAQESDLLGGSFFTHHWIAGLYGQADVNGDGLVTLEEAYRFAHYRTVEHTTGIQGGVQHPSYRFDLSGRGSVVLANLSHATSEIRVRSSDRAGQYFVLDPHRQLVLTELVRSDSGRASLRLPPGRYQIRKREQDRFLVSDLTIASGETVQLRDRDMDSIRYRVQETKGGARVVHALTAALGVRSAVTEGIGVTPELRLAYRLNMAGFFFEPRFEYRHFGLVNNDSHHLEFDLGVALGGSVWLGQGRGWRLSIGGEGGVVAFERIGRVNALILQSGKQPQGAVRLGLSTGMFSEVERALGEDFYVGLRGEAGVLVFELDGETKAPFVFSLGLGLGYRFE